MSSTPVVAEQRLRLEGRARLLAGVSVTYNLVEAVVAVTAGAVAGSIALIGSAWTRWSKFPAGS